MRSSLVLIAVVSAGLATTVADGARAACTTGAACAQPATATSDDLFNSMYLRGSVGYGIASKPNVSIEGWSVDGFTRNNSLSSSFALGGWVTPDWRVELSVNPIFASRIEYRAPTAVMNGTTYSGGVRNTSTIVPIMFDIYRDFYTGTAFRPYVGAGAGVALTWSDLTADMTAGTTSVEYKVASAANASFAASAMAGIGYDLSKNVTLDLGYKYLYIDEIQTKKTIEGYELTAKSKNNSFNQFFVGARFRFD